MSEDLGPTVVVGRVGTAHGVDGEVTVLVLSEVPERFADGAVVFLSGGRRLAVESTRPHRGRLLVKFREVSDRTEAERLQAQDLVIPESMVPPPPVGRWWPHQLEGCRIETEGGRLLGTLTDVVPNPANDIWVATDDEGNETLVPVLEDVIVSVDVAGKRIVVREIPGLTVPDEPSA